MRYEKYNLKQAAELARHYIVAMTDKKYDHLPYWFINITDIPAYAKHVRVDDAELVASWYEALVSIRKILGNDRDALEVEAAFKRHLMKSWGPMGLRYHEYYPWSNTNHSAFHEMSYVLSALNRALSEEPNDAEVEKRASRLVRGMRKLVIHRKIRTFWSGDFPYQEKLYEFPNDVYLRKGGWVMERDTGRGEQPIRNAMMLHALVTRAEKFNDEVALDLATGMANHLMSLSRYFNWKGEFFGHVHSATWFASGLARLGRITGTDLYKIKANMIHNYVKSLSSDFGWVPEYGQWHPANEEHSETCCIKDMIECSTELIDCGYDYYDLLHKFARNQLAEQQFKTGSFISVDNTREDKDGMTWKDIDKRVVGGFSGGGEPNSINLARFRAVAGCCVGTAPQALLLVYNRIIQKTKEGVFVNLPLDREDRNAKVEAGYPNDGYLKVTAKTGGKFFVRTFDWMGGKLEIQVNDKNVPAVYSKGCLLFDGIKPGDTITLTHGVEMVKKNQVVGGREYTVCWKGPDVVRLDPPGQPIMLYQRVEGAQKEIPAPPNVGPDSMKNSMKQVSMKPTEQKASQ